MVSMYVSALPLIISFALLTHRRAALHMESAHGIPIVHSIESSHLIHTHRRHLQQPRHLIHDTDAGKAVLALSEVEQRHYGGFLVLAGVSAEDLLDELLILCVEFEGYRGVVFGSIAVLEDVLEGLSGVRMAGLLVHTTMSEALRDALDTWNVRRCSLIELRNALALPLRAHGASLEAMVDCV